MIQRFFVVPSTVILNLFHTISHSIGGYSGLLRFAHNDVNLRHCEEPKATKQPSFVCHLIDKWYQDLMTMESRIKPGMTCRGTP